MFKVGDLVTDNPKMQYECIGINSQGDIMELKVTKSNHPLLIRAFPVGYTFFDHSLHYNLLPHRGHHLTDIFKD